MFDSSGQRANIFGWIKPLCTGNQALESAIVLLCATHARQDPVVRMKHRNTALSQFKRELLGLDDCVALAVIFVLLFTDMVESGRSPWRIHLSAVKTIIGNRIRRGQRLAQDGLQTLLLIKFFWWDTLGALLSGQRAILPYNWLAQILCQNQSITEIQSLMNDFGCSRQTLLAMNSAAQGLASPTEDTLDSQAQEPVNMDANVDSMCPVLKQVPPSDELWRDTLFVCEFVSVSPYPATREVFDRHVQGIFDQAERLATPSRVRMQILFPLVAAGSCTADPNKRQFIRQYCESCFDETGFGFYKSGFSTLQESWRLRKEEAKDRELMGGRAYTCWRNLTTTGDAAYAMLG